MPDEKPMISRSGAGFDSRRLHPHVIDNKTEYAVPAAADGLPAQILPKTSRWHGLKRPAARVPSVCDVCGSAFQALKQQVKIGAGRLCSKACQSAAAIANGTFAGEKNPRWLGGVSTDNMRYRRRQRERTPERDNARRMVNYAISRGRIVRGPCERCGSTTKIEGHHDDYSKPLELRWLCRRHHVDVHLELRAAGNDPDPTGT